MNFIIKNVLKKIFTQYLYIEDEGLDLTSGIIKLPLGTINQTRINEKLEPLGVRITSSLYKNLIIHLPIVELTSKPIRISIQVLDVVVERVYRREEGSQRKESWSSVESSIENTSERETTKDVAEQQKQGGYFRNIINRLLYNMQICMDKINIRLIDTREEQEFRQAYFTLHSFKLKNSLVILEANIVKKTLTMDELHLRHAVGQVIVKDLSLCLDFSNKKLHVIAVGGNIRLDVFKIPYSIIMKGLNKKKPTKSKNKPVKNGLLQGTSLFLKLATIQVCFKLVETVMNSIEVRSKTNAQGSEMNVNFKSIKCMNMSRQRQELCLVQFGYLPFNQLVKINSEYQDSAIKQTWINFKQIQNADSKVYTLIKVYHLSINVNVDQWKDLVDKVLLRQRETQKIKGILDKIKENDAAEPQTIAHKDERKSCIDALVYRLLIKIHYGPSRLEIFGSSLFQIRQQAINNNNSPIIGNYKQSIREKENEQAIQATLINVYQLGVRAFNCNILQISDLRAKITQKEVIVNGNSIISQLAISCHDKVIDQVSIVQRDIAYYQQKIKKYWPNREVQRLQIDKNEADISNNDKDSQLSKKIYLKFDETTISIGQSVRNPTLVCSTRSINSQKQVQQVIFISIIDIQLSKLLLAFINDKIKLNFEAILFISSPYTLERTPLTNELQVQLNFGIPSNELSLSFKNKLVILIQDHYINIIYKLLDRQDVWCSIINLTHQDIVLVQQTNHFTSILSERVEKREKIGLSQVQSYNYNTIIHPNSTKNVFWIGNDTFRVSMGNRQSRIVSAKITSPQSHTKNSRLCYETIKELIFSQDKDYDYILKMQYNKLGNLFQIIIDYKILITSYSNSFLFKIGTHSFEVRKSKRQRWQWFLQLQDLSEDFEHYQVISADKRSLKIEQLMAHQQFNIMGIYENAVAEAPLLNRKLYHGYIYQNKTGYQLRYTIMPLLIITNNCLQQFQLEITDKKTQQKQIIVIKHHQSIQLTHNQHFDYYLRQFTIKISVMCKQQITFESESLYFNTFFMVDHKTQTNVLLRSTKKSNYSKKSLIFQQSLLLKTKVITLKSSLHINNSTDFHFTCQTKQASKAYTEKIDIDAHTISQWTHRIKEDSIIQFLINNNIENKVEIRYVQLKEMKLFSFNFCKIQDRFFNVFIRVQRRHIQGIETIILDHFVEIINLCNHVQTVSLQDFPPFEQGIRTNLPLNSTSLNKYNNKPIDLDDIAKIYAQIFLTPKVTDLPLSFILGKQLIKLELFLKQSTQQLQIQRNKLIVTLLKDMNNNKITFYLTDRLFNQKLHYTIFNNETKAHFLLTDDFEYAPHFSNIEESCSNVPLKVLIGHNSFNCLMNRQNYDLLLCDKYETHLQKIDKKVLEKQGIKLQQYNFDTLTLFDCTGEQQKIERKQFTTKEVQIRIRMYEKVQLSISLHALTLRLLETGKLDCLIQDISIKNQQTNDHLLRIPQQTYLLFEGRLLHQGYFLLIKNLFVKCKNVIVNMKRQMPYSLIELMTTLSERLGLNIDQGQISQQADPRRYRQTIKKLQGQTKLKNHVKQALLLIRNLYIHEIHLSLTIQLENLSFSNVIILPFYEIEGKFERARSFSDSLANFYLTTLLAKFPKLSFLMSNFRSPLNTVRLFFNLREALKIKVQNQPIVNFGHADFSSNPFHFSKQRWNIIHNQIVGPDIQQVNSHEQIVCYLFQGKKCLILTSLKIYWLDEQWINWNLRDLQSLKINRNRVGSELILKFHGKNQLVLVQQHKRCVRMLNNIQKLLL